MPASIPTTQHRRRRRPPQPVQCSVPHAARVAAEFLLADVPEIRLPEGRLDAAGVAESFATNVSSQLDDRQSLGAARRAGREIAVPQSSAASHTVPSPFLSLLYTGIVSGNMVFTATFAPSGGRGRSLLPR